MITPHERGTMPFDSDQPPTFTTVRLTLRPRTLADLDACLAMDRDPLVTKFIHGPWADPVAHRAFVEARMRHVYPAGMGYWSIFASARFIGWILLTPLDLHGPDIEIGWRLVRAAWGHGFATEAARPVLDHARHRLCLRRILADIDPANTGSIRVARKLGLVQDGTVLYGGRTVIRYVATTPA
jgi:RimJ/RimL family protein N-acetyltransferase